MGNHFVNVFTEYKSYILTNKYIKETLLKVDADSYDYVIVDNSLNDENFEKLSTYYNNDYEVIKYEEKEIRKTVLTFENKTTTVYFVKNNVNSGYGSGANLAMKVAVKFLNPNYLIISNNDMVSLDEKISLNKVIETFESDNKIGLIGVNVKNLDQSQQSPYREVNFIDRWILPELFFPFSRKFKKRKSSDLINNAETGYVYRVRGSYMILRAEAFIASKGFDEKIFLYAEEPILAERIKRKGYLTYHLNDINMLHDHEMDNVGITRSEIKKIQQRYKSELYYYKTYKGTSNILLFISKLLFPQYIFREKVYRKLKDKL